MAARHQTPDDAQLPLFGGDEGPAGGPPENAAARVGAPAGSAGRAGRSGASVQQSGVGAAPPDAATVELGARLPPGVHLGGSTWSFPGWAGHVYDRAYTPARLARDGLAAYARHPLLRAVGLDRTHYRPLPAPDLAAYAEVVPLDFLFLVKAHEACTLERWPDHPRYGAERGRPNPLFLDAGYTASEVVAPYVEGLGARGGALLFEFAPQDLGTARRFAARLHAFLAALPRGVCYAVELRNRELLTADYAAALAGAGACHCLTVHPRMPNVRVQAHLAGVLAADAAHAAHAAHAADIAPGCPVVGRWLLGAAGTYEAAARRFAPFNRLAAPDLEARRAWADLARRALAAGRRFLLTVNNNAEGCAPLSIVSLAHAIVDAPA